MRYYGIALLSFAAACGPSSGSTAGDGSSGDGVTTGMSDGTLSGTTSGAPPGDSTGGSTGPAPGTTTGSTGEVGSSGSETSTGEGSTGADTGETTGGPACGEPDPEPVAAAWSIAFPGDKPLVLWSKCTVAMMTEQPPQWSIQLDCQGDPIDIKVTRAPTATPPLFIGHEVELEFHSEQVFWSNEWFSIQYPDSSELLVGGVSADRLVPDGTTAEEFFGTAIAVEEGLCAPGGDDPCGPVERLALVLTWFGEAVHVFDAQWGWAVNLPGSYSIWVETARRPVAPQQCEDLPPAWFQVMMQADIGP